MKSPNGDLHYMHPTEEHMHTLDRDCRCGPSFLRPCDRCARDSHGRRLHPRLGCERCNGMGVIPAERDDPLARVVVHSRIIEHHAAAS